MLPVDLAARCAKGKAMVEEFEGRPVVHLRDRAGVVLNAIDLRIFEEVDCAAILADNTF